MEQITTGVGWGTSLEGTERHTPQVSIQYAARKIVVNQVKGGREGLKMMSTVIFMSPTARLQTDLDRKRKRKTYLEKKHGKSKRGNRKTQLISGQPGGSHPIYFISRSRNTGFH